MGKTIRRIARTSIIVWLLLLCSMNPVKSQSDSTYWVDQVLRFENRTYTPVLKTVILERVGEPLSEPVLFLNGNDKLILHFDLLEEEVRDLSYRFIHCDRYWKPSGLSENDYIQGFYSDHITEYAHSLNTNLDYWHYQLIFPGEQISPSISGNYLLVVFENKDPEKALLTRRFRVIEPVSEINPNIHRATSIDKRNTHQEIDFNVKLHAVKVAQPYSEILVEIIQNGNDRQSIRNLKPFFVNGDILDFNLDEGNLFEGGSEFRELDLRTTRFLTASVASFETGPLGYKNIAVLKPDQRRSSERYSTAEDLNGKYLAKIYEGRDANTEGDYLNVIFQLKAPADFTENAIYLDGIFTEFRTDERFRLQFSADSAVFRQSVLLKQGLYNYRYISSDTTGVLTSLETEGSHFEAKNQYEILVYWSSPLARYDRLIGYIKTNCGN